MATSDVTPQLPPESNPLAALLSFYIAQVEAINTVLQEEFEKNGKRLVAQPFEDEFAHHLYTALNQPEKQAQRHDDVTVLKTGEGIMPYDLWKKVE